MFLLIAACYLNWVSVALGICTHPSIPNIIPLSLLYSAYMHIKTYQDTYPNVYNIYKYDDNNITRTVILISEILFLYTGRVAAGVEFFGYTPPLFPFRLLRLFQLVSTCQL